MMNNIEHIDFGRSHLTFRTTRVNHTPRLVLDGACTMGGKRYFLTCACIGEAMYLREGLIHEPVMEFNLIASPRDQFVMIKRMADAEDDVRSVHKFGDVMPTHDGKGAKMIELDVHLRPAEKAEPITTYAQFRAALLEAKTINGRTTFTDEDGSETVMDYPCKTVNVRHDAEDWQVDAGPVLMPAGPQKGEFPVARLDMAYIVYNRFDYSETVIRQRTAIKAGGATNHYSLRQNLTCRNEIFVME